MKGLDEAKRLVSVGPADEHVKERMRVTVCKILREETNYIDGR
jgi:hypothetical protein